MKRFAPCCLLTLCLFLSAGCIHSQQITPTPVLSCKPATDSSYSQVNLATPTTATTLTDAPGAGSNCYFVQTVDGSGVSQASNIPPPQTTTASLTHVVLTWSAPAGYTCVSGPCKYVVSRGAAVQTAVGVPSNLAPSTTAQAAPPVIPDTRAPIGLELLARK